MAYPPQQGQYGGYPGHGAPPKKDRAPLIASMIFVVAVLAGLGITGFVTPGFFLGDDDGGGNSSASGDSGGGGIEDGPKDPDMPGVPGSDEDPAGGPADGPADGPGTDGGVSAEDGEAFVEEFITAVNDLDSVGANEMVCADAPSNSLVDFVIKKDPELAIDSVENTKYFLDVELKGTLGGEPLNLGKVTVKLTDSNAPCVFTFNAG
ncbi:hypothetical protein [Actinophytocola sp. NPDC049390]|uniref:hypothetical protein n=1 Tax=Actinophytocola sp. NPDC049390 TaxID=3363894 RepID=UPI0037A00744